MTPEHILYSVGDVKDTYANALSGFVQRVEKHLLAFPMNQVTLFEKRVFSQVAVVQSPGIFGEPHRGLETLEFRQINRIRQRMRNRQCGMHRVDVHRRGVQFQLRLDRLKVKPADPLDAGADPGPELQFHPLRVFARGNRDALAIDVNVDRPLRHRWLEPERRTQLNVRICSQSVGGARDVRMEIRAVLLEMNNDPICCRFAHGRACRVERECALSSLDVWHTHSRQQNSRKLFRGKCDWHANYGTKYTGVSQIVPERGATAERFNLGTSQRDRIAANF